MSSSPTSACWLQLPAHADRGGRGDGSGLGLFPPIGGELDGIVGSWLPLAQSPAISGRKERKLADESPPLGHTASQTDLSISNKQKKKLGMGLSELFSVALELPWLLLGFENGHGHHLPPGSLSEYCFHVSTDDT